MDLKLECMYVTVRSFITLWSTCTHASPR